MRDPSINIQLERGKFESTWGLAQGEGRLHAGYHLKSRYSIYANDRYRTQEPGHGLYLFSSGLCPSQA